MKDPVLRLFDEVFNAARHDVADEIIDPDFVIHGGSVDEVRGPDAIRAKDALLRTAFPDLRFEIDDLVAEGHKVAVRWTMYGTHRGEYLGVPGTGRSVRLRACMIFHVGRRAGAGDARITDVWPIVDVAGALEQLTPAA